MTSIPPPPGWYPDQQNPRLHRWWDGQAWSPNTRPAQPIPMHDAEAIELDIERAHDPARIQAQVARGTRGRASGAGGGGTLFTEPILVVNQRAKLIELANEFGVFDQNGQRLGGVVEVGQSTVKKVVRLLTNYDQFLTHRFEVRDANHSTVLKVTRPAKVFKSRFLVTRADDSPIGEIVQENVFGKIRLGFVVNGQKIGGIYAENWRAWNFAIKDHNDVEIAKITKTWGGFVKAAFTTADNYVVEIHRPLQDPLASMVVASALTIDTALKQDSD
ncbi:phospholipid scramblase-related protein [Amycolatopsis sp. H20-H5]|uniref:phospholipid scramblase-related protein n=1 Tax=Amycolatopsis sp. H20-H5 TaxID=3046309 RepID=UPI002DBD5989|nr:phospholipid scramblase-related protein [Amycolatopsis sp. H20-H5]MEC3973815.1 phospholipid scramblase-related protein [Amycolatopsis sp. H20-H5]